MKFSQYPFWVLQFAKYLLILWCWAINWHIISESVSLILERKCGSFQMHRDKRNAHCLYLYAMSARSVPTPYYTSVGYCLFVHRSFHNLLSDKRTTPHFLFYITRHIGAEWQQNYFQNGETELCNTRGWCYWSGDWEGFCCKQRRPRRWRLDYIVLIYLGYEKIIVFCCGFLYDSLQYDRWCRKSGG